MSDDSKPTGRQARKQEPAKAPDPVVEGVYVAKEALYVDGARAFAPGDLVPAEHVNRFVWQDKVRAFDDDTESEG